MRSSLRGILATRRRKIVAALSTLLALALAAFLVLGSSGPSPPRHQPAATPPPPAPHPVEASFYWPFYGYTKSRSRFFPAAAKVRPPFKQLWVHHGSSLLEFPPVIANKRIFQLADNGILSATNKDSGHDFWWRRIGAASASTPAVIGGRVFATVLERSPGLDAGRVVALDASSGKILWSRDLPSRSESSPVVDNGRVFFGSEDGTVYALDASNGRSGPLRHLRPGHLHGPRGLPVQPGSLRPRHLRRPEHLSERLLRPLRLRTPGLTSIWDARGRRPPMRSARWAGLSVRMSASHRLETHP
jgi:PQQ-like domain